MLKKNEGKDKNQDTARSESPDSQRTYGIDTLVNTGSGNVNKPIVTALSVVKANGSSFRYSFNRCLFDRPDGRPVLLYNGSSGVVFIERADERDYKLLERRRTH